MSAQRAMLTAREVGLMLGVSIGTVRKLVRAGYLKQRTYGYRTKRISRDSVERHIRSTPPETRRVA